MKIIAENQDIYPIENEKLVLKDIRMGYILDDGIVPPSAAIGRLLADCIDTFQRARVDIVHLMKRVADRKVKTVSFKR